MAELPHIGDHCSSCKRLDFLPIVCVYCKNIFCKDHLSTEIHQCPDFITSDRIIVETPDKHDHEKCDFCSQIVKNRLEMVKCDHCQSTFCLTHRHPEGHGCSSTNIETIKTPSAYQLIASASSSSTPAIKPSTTTTPKGPKGPKGAKNDSLAKKVALMKLKQSAIGLQSIPQSERLYFNLDLGNRTIKSIYLSSNWTIGKAVDYISSKFNLTNNNNKLDQPKLVIVTETLQTLSFDSSLAQLVDERSIETGQSLFMKYIDPVKR